MNEITDILPWIQGGGTGGVIGLLIYALHAWRAMNDRLQRIELNLVRLTTALRILRPSLAAILDEENHKGDTPHH